MTMMHSLRDVLLVQEVLVLLQSDAAAEDNLVAIDLHVCARAPLHRGRNE
jgi:hypothetical protein